MNERHDAKLEMYIDKLRENVERLTAENARLTVENERLRNTLEWYANPDNWINIEWDGNIYHECDGGLMASEALKGKGGKQTACKWESDPDHEISVWNTSCGEAFGFSECTPKEAGCIYCTHCGRMIEFVEQEEGGGEG